LWSQGLENAANYHECLWDKLAKRCDIEVWCGCLEKNDRLKFLRD